MHVLVDLIKPPQHNVINYRSASEPFSDWLTKKVNHKPTWEFQVTSLKVRASNAGADARRAIGLEVVLSSAGWNKPSTLDQNGLAHLSASSDLSKHPDAAVGARGRVRESSSREKQKEHFIQHVTTAVSMTGNVTATS